MVEIKDYLYPGIFEFIGSVILGATVNEYKRNASSYLVLAFGALAAHVICWKVSRAHLNPAVSLANLLRRDTKFNFGHFLIFIAAQFGGFTCGLMLQWWFNREPGTMAPMQDTAGTDQIHEAMALEFVASL
jgi:glycerol uptake facilitator-like aquaporin